MKMFVSNIYKSEQQSKQNETKIIKMNNEY
jgi:hypothetical protein